MPRKKPQETPPEERPTISIVGNHFSASACPDAEAIIALANAAQANAEAIQTIANNLVARNVTCLSF